MVGTIKFHWKAMFTMSLSNNKCTSISTNVSVHTGVWEMWLMPIKCQPLWFSFFLFVCLNMSRVKHYYSFSHFFIIFWDMVDLEPIMGIQEPGAVTNLENRWTQLGNVSVKEQGQRQDQNRNKGPLFSESAIFFSAVWILNCIFNSLFSVESEFITMGSCNKQSYTFCSMKLCLVSCVYTNIIVHMGHY